MIEHVQKIKKLCCENNIKFTILQSEKSFDYYLFEHEPKRRNKNLVGKKGYGWPGSRNRWCTSKLKIDII
jgi:hypothetical protein